MYIIGLVGRKVNKKYALQILKFTKYKREIQDNPFGMITSEYWTDMWINIKISAKIWIRICAVTFCED